jgi:vitamin B12 transporter
LDYQPTDSLGFSVGYTYLTAYDESAGQRLLRRPRHMLQLSTSYQFTDALRAGLQGTGYFDREDSQVAFPFGRIDHEDQFVVRLVVDWEIDSDWTIFARAENLLDEEYAPTVGFPALGRTGYIGARYNF